jgi:transposase
MDNMTGRKLSDIERWQAAGMVIGGMSYRQTTERFNVSHSVIVRLKQRVNQTGNAKERHSYRFENPGKLEFCKGTSELMKALFRRSLINRPIQNYRYHERIL